MKKVFVQFTNHFDLIWRRCWDRFYSYQGGRYLSYRQVEEACILKAVELADCGKGAYSLEQAISLRAFLKTHPNYLDRIKALHDRGLFEVMGAGEAIIDINMCQMETMCRNLASGLRYFRDTLGAAPFTAHHADGFGSSAQFPQIIRKCGLKGVSGLSYAYPDNDFWRGMDGSTVFVWYGGPGRSHFFDHCYHEPCRICRGTGLMGEFPCDDCEGLGIDLPQNFYPAFEPLDEKDFKEGWVSTYTVASEEMLPPSELDGLIKQWSKRSGVEYVWGSPRNALAPVFEDLGRQADCPAVGKLSSKAENNPVQTGCLVSRARIKKDGRRVESAFYAWEMALNLSCQGQFDRRGLERLFLELPLVFFHDSVTGTHQDNAYYELIDRMRDLAVALSNEGMQALRRSGVTTALAGDLQATRRILAFNPSCQDFPQRIPLAVSNWRSVKPLVAVGPFGKRYPLVFQTHSWSPARTRPETYKIAAVGKDARTRPDHSFAYLETQGVPPLCWTEFKLESAAEPVSIASREISNGLLSMKLGEHGVESVADLATGVITGKPDLPIGSLRLDEDEGDPWGTRKLPSFRKDLSRFTRLLDVKRFDGYVEAYYFGVFEPSTRFGREEDPKIFSLVWQTTVRLLDHAKRVDFSYEIYWKTADRRIRAVFPTGAADDSGFYSIPGGWLERPRYEQTETCLWSPNGDWPALHFVAAKPSAQGIGWAVVNYGSPSARIEEGSILVSLLRSPSFGHCLERYAQDYPMPMDGIRDGGWHHFTLSFVPHVGASDMPRLALEASALNQVSPVVGLDEAAVIPEFKSRIAIETDGVELLAAKAPFGNAEGLVLRLINLKAVPAAARISITDRLLKQASEVLMTELEGNSLPIDQGCVTLEFTAFEVKTIRLE